MVQAQIAAAAAAVDCCVDDLTAGFELSGDLVHLNGSERTALAGRLGAGLCDLLMISMGYVWRDQADKIIHTKKPLADFVYEGPPAQSLGVVLAEAKGTTTKGTQAATQTRADKAYQRQVSRYIGLNTRVGRVIHGYAVSFRAPLGKPGYLCVAETGIFPVGSHSAEPASTSEPSIHQSANVSASTAIGNFATALRLIGAEQAGQDLANSLFSRSSRARAVEALSSLLKTSGDGNYIRGSSGSNLLPYAGISFGIRKNPLVALHNLLERAGEGPLHREVIELPIYSKEENLISESESFVEFPDGVVAFADPNAEAFGMRLVYPELSQGRVWASRSQEELERVVLVEPFTVVEDIFTTQKVRSSALRKLGYESNE
jgi:hypothetical protein